MPESDVDVLRATAWDEFFGQARLKERLTIHVDAAISLDKPLPHVLLTGPPGFGKTSMAGIIASCLNDPFGAITIGAGTKASTLTDFLVKFPGGVLLLDEIHRASKGLQEDLLTLLEENWMPYGNRGSKLRMQWLTVVGATTEPEKITPALYDRFPIKPPLDPYSPVEMTQIVEQMFTKVEMEANEELITTVSVAAAGVPRNARHLVLTARDIKISRGEVSPELLLQTCQMDATGLSQPHLDYLSTLKKLGGTAGLDLIATMMRLHPTILREVERLLVDRQFILYTPKGRELTSGGWSHGVTHRSHRDQTGARISTD